jgi:biopolymer transport protein ExbD
MAEIQQQENSRKHGSFRRKKLSTRVDLTPMVDLGFLLITFFIFTTALSKPTAMGLILPADKKSDLEGSVTPESKTLNLILSSDNTVVYYNGLDKKHAATTDYSTTGLRTVVLNKMTEVYRKTGNVSEMVVLIKPTNSSTYKNIVDVLDEMKINNVKKFVLMDASKEELNLFLINKKTHYE